MSLKIQHVQLQLTLSNPFRPILHNPGMSKDLREWESLLRVVSKELRGGRERDVSKFLKMGKDENQREKEATNDIPE